MITDDDGVTIDEEGRVWKDGTYTDDEGYVWKASDGTKRTDTTYRCLETAQFQVLWGRWGGPPSRGRGLHPRQVPQAWIAGLKAAGVKAKVATLHKDGGWKTLPLVITYDCPVGHVDDEGEGFTKIVLRVDVGSGWVFKHRDSCPDCSQADIEDWLMTCPRCAAGEALETHPDHDDLEADGAFCVSCEDESPVSLVAGAMSDLRRGRKRGQVEPPPKMTVEAAVALLDMLIEEDGTQTVPPSAGQAAAWNAVKGLPQHPSQDVLRKAQAIRKARG